jgi:hypothetical protein
VGKTNNLKIMNGESSVLASKSHDQPTPSDAYGIWRTIEQLKKHKVFNKPNRGPTQHLLFNLGVSIYTKSRIHNSLSIYLHQESHS